MLTALLLIYIFSLLHFSLVFPFGPGSALAQETLIVFTFFSPSFLQSLDLFERGLLQHPNQLTKLCVNSVALRTPTDPGPCSAFILLQSLPTMVSKSLMGVWVALDVLLLLAGVLSVALSIVWRAPNILMNMVLSPADLTGALYPYHLDFACSLSYP